MKFIRYGSLKPQYHDTSDDWVHTPPVAWGFYAFPKGYVEKFLLGGLGEGSVENGRIRYVRDENGNKIIDDFDNIKVWNSKKMEYEYTEKYEDLLFNKLKLNRKRVRIEYYKNDENKTGRSVIYYENEPKIFEYNGDIWHHFDVCGNVTLLEPGDIIQRTEYWVKTTISDYKKALDAYVTIHKYNSVRGTISQNPGGYPTNRLEKDMYEVYIESIQKSNKQSKKKK